MEDNRIKLIWKPKMMRHETGHRGHLGKWPVMETYWDACATDPDFGDRLTWRVVMNLPGIRSIRAFMTEEQAMHFCENAVKHWLDNAGLIYKQMKTPRVR